MRGVEARLIASALALIAGAILYTVGGTTVKENLGQLVFFAAAVLFCVEYVRSQWPTKGPGPEGP